MQVFTTISIRSKNWVRVSGLTLLLVLCDGLFAQADQPAERPIRLGFSTQLFSGLNEADARASVRTLTATISRDKKIAANPDPLVTQTIGEAETALRTGAIDALGMTTEELWALGGKVSFDRYLYATSEGSSEEIYLLLVSKKNPARSLRELQGQRVVLHSGARASLALQWLDLELARANQPDCAHFFSTITESIKATKATLPVFFQQIDACLITQRSYNTVVEMNPQVGRELRIIAQSPPCIPLIIAFRSGFAAAVKGQVINEICDLQTTSYGQQGLMIFQTQRIVEKPRRLLDPTLALLDEHARLCPAASANRLSMLARPREQSSLTP